MAKTNARRILSILLCVAMVASLFTVSFTASAAETGVIEEGDYTYYNWDFTNPDAGRDYFEETKDYSYRISTSANPDDAIFHYNEDLSAYEISSVTNSDSTRGVILKTPAGKLANSMVLETGAVADFNDFQPHGTIIIAEDENGYYGIKSKPAIYNGGELNYELYYFMKQFNEKGEVVSISKKISALHGFTIATVNGEDVTTSDAATAKNVYKLTGGALKFDNDHKDFSGYHWTYDVKIVDETDIKVTVTAVYGDYTFVSTEMTFNYDEFLNNSKFGPKLTALGATVTHAKFTPVLGFANSQGRGVDENPGVTDENKGCQIYRVEAAFKVTDKCLHEDTEVRDAVPATCEEEGYSGDTYCLDCDQKLADGAVLPALGHDFEVTREEPDIGKEGSIIRTCKRCGHTEVETIPALESFTVTFLNDDGDVFHEEEVGEGHAAVGPEGVPDSNEGWTFIGWDTDYTKVLSALTIRPVFYDTESEVNSYEFDFTNPDTAKSDLVKFKYLTKTTSGNATDYIDEELGGMVIPFKSQWGHLASVLWNAKDSSMKSFTLKGSAPDAHWNSTHTPGVVFAADEDGVYAYKIEAGEINGFTRKVFFLPYNNQKTGFSGAWSLMLRDVRTSTIVAVDGNELESPMTNIQKAALAAGFDIDVKTANQNQRYFTYEYTGEVQGSEIHINTTAVYDDGNTQATFTMQEEVFSLQDFIDNAENYANGSTADLNFYNAMNREENPMEHKEFDWTFGLYDYAGNNPAGFGTTGNCLITYVSVDYVNYPEDPELCKHDPRSRTTDGYKPATCGVPGYTGEVVCGYCGKVFEEGSEIPALDHNFVITEVVDPTSDKEGRIVYTCTNCGDTKTETIPPRKLTYTSYNWDFSDRENADNNIADMRVVSTTYAWWAVWNDDDYDGIHDGEQKTFGHGYDSDRGVYYMKHANRKGLNIMSFANPDGYFANKLVAEGGTYDADTAINNNFAVVIGKDTNGIYVYYVYVNNNKEICRELRYVEYMTYDGKEAGVYSPVNEPDQCPVMTSLCSNMAEQSSDALVAAYLDGATPADAVSNVNAQFPLFIKSKAAFKFKYTVTSSYNETISVNCEITYDDGTSSYKWTTLTETFDIKNFAKLAEGNNDFGNFNKIEHNETEASFGIAMMSPGVDNQIYHCGVYGVTAEYAKETTCDHLNGTKVVGVKAATCTEDGYTGDEVCVDCEAIIEKGTTIAAKGHVKSGDAKETVAATCKNEGYSIYVCAVCGEDFKTDIVPATGNHTPADARKDAKDATCTEPGYTGDVVCKDCGDVITKGEEIPAKGHTKSGEAKETVAATCKDEGYSIYVCAVCGEDFKTDIVPATGNHTPADARKDAKDATCTEPGYTGDVVCKDCGTVITKGEEIPAKGHTPAGAGVVTEPTCTEDGYTTFHCSVCDKDYTEAGEKALGHDYQWVVTKPATDTEKGLEEHKCSRCGNVDDSREIPVISTVKYGDVNEDGVVDSSDAILVLRYDAKSVTFTEKQLKAADVDGNGVANANDAILILRYDAKAISIFPVEEKK